MTEQEVDELIESIAQGPGTSVHSLAMQDLQIKRLKAALKSLIADGERLDWLEKQKRANCPWENQVSIVFNWDEDQTLREAIDYRRAQA